KAQIGQGDLRALAPLVIAHVETRHLLAREAEGVLDRLVQVEEVLLAADLDVAEGFIGVVDQHMEAMDAHGRGYVGEAKRSGQGHGPVRWAAPYRAGGAGPVVGPRRSSRAKPHHVRWGCARRGWHP